VRDFDIALKRVKDACKNRISERKQELKTNPTVSSNTLLDVLLQNEELTSEYIIDQFMFIFLAVTETTGRVLAMCLYQLTKYPEHLETLRQEIKEKIQDNLNPTYQELGQLPFLAAFIKETMRCVGPGPLLIFREAVADHYLEEIPIKKGTFVLGILKAPAYNETYFKNADEFNPSRWIKDEPEDPYAFLPFWVGLKSCPGQFLSGVETKTTLIRLVTQYDFSVPEDYKLKMTMKLSYGPDDVINMKFTHRNKSKLL